MTETELVLSLSRTWFPPALEARVRDSLRGPVDWDEVRRRAEQGRVASLVAFSLRTRFADVVPAEALAEVEAWGRAEQVETVSRTLVLLGLLRAFAAARIPVLVLKGAAVGARAYGDFTLRPFADLDFLVAPADLFAARDLLAARGYASKHSPEEDADCVADDRALELTNESTTVELHASLLERHLRVALSTEELFRRAERVVIKDVEVPALSAPDLLVYLCAHGAKHEWALLRWVCDVAELARRMTPAELAAAADRARRTGTRRILALGLALARDLLGAEVSPALVATLGEARVVERIAAPIRDRLNGLHARPTRQNRHARRLHPNLPPLLFWIGARERWRDRLRVAAALVSMTSASDRDRFPLPAPLRPLHVALRPLRLAGVALARSIRS